MMKRKCSRCEGTGWVMHPRWKEAYEKFGPNPGYDELMNFFGCREEDWPPEEIPCRECEGKGEIEGIMWVKIKHASGATRLSCLMKSKRLKEEVLL